MVSLTVPCCLKLQGRLGHMSIAERIGERAENLASREAKGAFIRTMFLLLKHGSVAEARDHAKAERASERVQAILQKAAIAGGGVDNWSSIADYTNVSTAFLESLRGLSVFDAVLADMIRAPCVREAFPSRPESVAQSCPSDR